MALGVDTADGVASVGQGRLADLVHRVDQSLTGFAFVLLELFDGGIITQSERRLVQQGEVSKEEIDASRQG